MAPGSGSWRKSIWIDAPEEVHAVGLEAHGMNAAII
jgi:hypothetical protein